MATFAKHYIELLYNEIIIVGPLVVYVSISVRAILVAISY